MVDGESVTTLVSHMETHYQDMCDILAGLDEKVATLDREWDGEAKQAYLTAHRKWHGDLDDMLATLKTLTSKAGKAGSALTGLDTAMSGAWQ
jgi:WXG100 family type VII secretion target